MIEVTAAIGRDGSGPHRSSQWRRASATWLADHFEDVPLIMVPCQAGRIDNVGVGAQAGFWGSILPAVWNFMLALRSRGLGSAWVTMNLSYPDGERDTAELAEIARQRRDAVG